MFRKFQDRVVAAASTALGIQPPNDNSNSNAIERLQALGDYSVVEIEAALNATSNNIDRAAELLLLQPPSQRSMTTPQHHTATTPVRTTTPTTTTYTNVIHNNISHDSNNNHDMMMVDEDIELQRALQQSLEVNSTNQHQHQHQHHQHQQSSLRSDVMNQAADAAMRRHNDKTSKKNSKGLNKSSNSTNTSAGTVATTTKEAYTTTAASSTNRNTIPIRTKSQSLLHHHHPDVKLIPKLQDKSVEEQIVRTVDRMKNHPAAVDTLYRALYMFYNNSNNNNNTNTTSEDRMKYRRIDTSTMGYQRSVANAPGTADFLRAMKFHPEGQWYNVSKNKTTTTTTTSSGSNPILVLSEPMYDPAIVYLGLSALEQIKLSNEYIVAKKQLVFIKDVTAILETTTTTNSNNTNSSHQATKSTVSEEEVRQQKHYLSLCPNEPSEGRGALVQIHITDAVTIRRRFDSDDTLMDVLHWIGGSVGTTIYNRIMNHTYCLIDVNQTRAIPLDVSGPAQHYTLQYIGCWPSGRLQLQPTPTINNSENNNGANDEQRNGTAAGATQISTITKTTMMMNGTSPSRGLATGNWSSDDE